MPAEGGVIFKFEDGTFRGVADCGTNEEWRRYVRANPIKPGDRGAVTGRVSAEKRVVHIENTRADPEFTYIADGIVHRTVLGVPLLREGDCSALSC